VAEGLPGQDRIGAQVKTENCEIVESLFQNAMLAQQEASLRPSGVISKSDAPLIKYLHDKHATALVSTLDMVSNTGIKWLTSDDPNVMAMAGGLLFAGSKSIGRVTTAWASGSFKQGVPIDGTDEVIPYEELVAMTEHLLSLTKKVEETAQIRALDKRQTLLFMVSFGSEFAEYKKSLGGLKDLDAESFNKLTVADKVLPPKKPPASEEEKAWESALMLTMIRVRATVEDEQQAAAHTRLGDSMEPIFKESVSALIEEVHTLAHEAGGKLGDCSSYEHQELILRSVFMLGRAVEEMAVTRLEAMDQLDP
jgi:hypothetical protein